MQHVLIEHNHPQLPNDLRPAPRVQARRLIESFHYLEGLPHMEMCRHVLGVYSGGRLVGVLAFSNPVARLEDQVHTLELRRMVLVPGLPDNSASRSLGMGGRWLKSHDPDAYRLISYCDQDQGHEGTIYRASNWKEIDCGGGGTWTGRRGGRRFTRAKRKRKFEYLLKPRKWYRFKKGGV